MQSDPHRLAVLSNLHLARHAQEMSELARLVRENLRTWEHMAAAGASNVPLSTTFSEVC